VLVVVKVRAAAAVSIDKSIRYSISGRDKDFFNLKDRVVSFKNSPDYERKPSYSLTLEIKNRSMISVKTITITIINIKEKTISIVSDFDCKDIILSAFITMQTGVF
jgi:hypothetical protein